MFGGKLLLVDTMSMDNSMISFFNLTSENTAKKRVLFNAWNGYIYTCFHTYHHTINIINPEKTQKPTLLHILQVFDQVVLCVM